VADAARPSRAALCGQMARAAARVLRQRMGVGRTRGGRTHQGLTPAESADYVEGVFASYVRAGAVAAAELDGARVLELGPGDNLGVAARFVAAGAAEVVAIDRFRVPRDPAREAAVYREIASRLPADERVRLGSTGARGQPSAVRSIEGVAIEDAAALLEPSSFRIVVSCAVLEEIADPQGALDVMDRLLAPGGLMIHQVDFRDYGLLSSAGGHPLAFLTLGDRTYRWITAGGTSLNRWRADDYREALMRRGYHVEVQPTEVVGGRLLGGVSSTLELSDDERDLVERARPELARRFRSRSSTDLAVAGAMIVARKPVHPSRDHGMAHAVDAPRGASTN
jgi:SAM-dependent methyltransferase